MLYYSETGMQLTDLLHALYTGDLDAEGDDRMNAQIEQLFHELAHLSPEARARYFEQHAVDAKTRREVEELLLSDLDAGGILTGVVSQAASRSLETLKSEARQCGPYRLLKVIGRGGMGAVYLAERADGEVRQNVAVKLLPIAAGDLQRERFLQERQILASLAHQNIARMLDAGHADSGQPFLAMEYVDGRPIDAFAAGLNLRQKLTLFLKVCAAVSYLHRNLIVHRDLKPSNILVTVEGEPKLLDFGIAKMLDVSTDATVTGLRMMTPDYASPEQVRGGAVTTATDIYSLGAVLYRLLTGKPAHEFEDHSAEAIAHVVTTREVTRPGKWSPELKGDLESILLKALRKDPQERYATVEQIAEDLQAFLESRPVQARSGNTGYRTRKFVRRYWIPVSAAALVIASLSAGLYVANRERAAADRERAVAQRRFDQVRQLANKVLALDGVIRVMPGSTKVRSEIVAMSQQYLEGLKSETPADPDLAIESAQAFLRLARVQGMPNGPNLGRYAEAEASLRKADDLLEQVLRTAPRNRKALLLSADVAQSLMILASTDHRRDQTLIEARKAAIRVERLLRQESPSQAELAKAQEVLTNVALAHKNEHLYESAIREARRSFEIAQSVKSVEVFPSNPLSIAADSLRASGDLQGALEAIREARRAIDSAVFSGEAVRGQVLYNVLMRQGRILGEDGNISLGRPAEAVKAFQQGKDVMEELAEKDRDDALPRIRMATASDELARILVHTDPRQALHLYDRALLRSREIRSNTDARREEARLLANSSYALRALHRGAAAKQRLDEALQLLRQTKAYPTNRINPDDEVAAVLRAWADFLADTGQPQGAAQIYQELLDKIMIYGSDPQSDLGDATKISSLDEALAVVDRRAGRTGDAERLEGQRLSLWRQWDRKLPKNPFILRQLAAPPVR